MKTRLMFYTDPHITCVNPRHRVDDYGAAILAKLRQAYDMAEAEGCEFIVMAGDLFNHHRIFSYELINDLMDILCHTNLDTYAVVGQHDIHAYNPETYKSSTLAFVSRHCGRLRILWEPFEVVPAVWLHPSHVWEDVNESLKPKTLCPGHYNILVAHHLIHNKTMMFETVPTSFFGKGPYDLVLSGDWHGGFEPHEVGAVWFCNPGALARRAIDEIDRVPQVAIIDIEKGNFPVIDQKLLTSAKPGVDVFGQDVIEAFNKDREAFDPTAFVTGMENLEAGVVDIHELVQKAGTATGVRQEVLTYLASKKL